MAAAPQRFRTHAFRITDTGLIGLVPNVLVYIPDEEWDATTGDIKAGHDFLERLWLQTRSLVNEHTELHWDPHRLSDSRAEQDAYWEKMSPWVSATGPQKLRDLRSSMNDFFTGWKEVVNPIGNAVDRNQMPLLLRMVYWQWCVLEKWFSDFGRSCDVLKGVNPTGRGANTFQSDGFLAGPPVICWRSGAAWEVRV